MPKHEAARTLVKSPPELWEVCSDPASLSRHLEPFGEIRITRLEPETTVAWEGERASGTVRIEPSGWGTRVTLTAAPVGEEPEEEAAPEPPPRAAAPPPPAVEPESPAEVAPAEVSPPRRGLFARLFGRRSAAPPPPASPPPEPERAPEPDPEPEPEPAAVELEVPAAPTPSLVDAAAVLDAALDSLGSAHHRPFSRG